jgi:hypothetical protein
MADTKKSLYKRGLGDVTNAKPKPKESTGALFVEMSTKDIEHYKELAKKMGGLKMRELVTRALQDYEQKWIEANANSTAEIIRQLWEPTPEQLADAAAARFRDIALPEMVQTERNRLVQMIDVPVLKQKLFDSDARINRLESDLARLKSIVDGMSP